MNKGWKMIILTMLLVFALHQTVFSQMRERSKVPEKYKWKLEDIFPSDQAWQKAKKEVMAKFDEILKFKGQLATSPSNLLACLELNSQILKQLERLSAYAYMKYSEDTRNSDALAMKQEADKLETEYLSKSAFLKPEIVKMDQSTIDKFLKAKPGLKIYKMYLDDIQRTKIHKLSESEERILAEVNLLANSPSSIYSVFKNAELPYPEIQLSDGTKAYLDVAGYSRYRALPNREDREKVFRAFWGTMNKFRRTFGEMLSSHVRRDVFYSKARKYQSSLEYALDANNIPVEVYYNLIENVNKNLDSFHRYLKIKKRLLQVDTLKYSDIYAPVVKGVDLNYSIEEAKDLVLRALNPLGSDYLDAVKLAFENRWIDVYPTLGKRSGAFSNSVYDVHPYVFLNYNGNYEDVSTLAHELGHAMHSYFTNKNQPYILSDYSIFVAEVASTFNEALLIRKVLDEIKDDEIRLSLLMNYLDGIKGTLFRQTKFAEFELRIHEMAEKGEPLTGETMTKLYGDLLKKYYGHNKGICYIDDLYAIEWAYIPHFYYTFYVYQYATSFTASTALVEKVLKGEKGAVKRYLEFLSSGASDYPISLLKKAGVDMTTAEPFEKTMEAMNRAMDEIETILAKIGK